MGLPWLMTNSVPVADCSGAVEDTEYGSSCQDQGLADGRCELCTACLAWMCSSIYSLADARCPCKPAAKKRRKNDALKIED
jgi:hypothetical protein